MLPISDTVFASFNWVPTLLVILVMPLVFIAIRPHAEDVQAYVPEPELPAQPVPQSNSPARRMDRSPFFNLFLLAAGIAAVVLGYLYLVHRGLKIAWTSRDLYRDSFGMYLAAGITLALGLQGFIRLLDQDINLDQS